MIVSEEQLTKEKTDEGEVWTTPWRMTRSEAYVDLVDATDYAQRYGEKAGMKAAATLEDEWEKNQHRAVFTFGRKTDASTESEEKTVRAGGGADDKPGQRTESSEADRGSGDKK